MPDRSGAEGAQNTPWYYDAKGNCPPWFDFRGKFVPDLFDPDVEYTPKGATYEIASNPSRLLESPFDLRNLRVIDPKSVVDAVEKLNKVGPSSKRTVAAIATGGTIASREIKGETVPGLDLNFLVNYSGRNLRQAWHHASISFNPLIDSSKMKLDYDADVVIAISYVWANLSEAARQSFRGFLVTHGTDTMAPSTTRIAMMLGPNLDFSVGFVGAQATIENPFNDISENFVRTLMVLDALKNKNRNGTFVFMGGTGGAAMHPAGTIKISDTRVMGFDSPALPKIMDLSDFSLAERLVSPFYDRYQLPRRWADGTQAPPERGNAAFAPIVVRGYKVSKTIGAEQDIDPEDIRNQIAVLGKRNIALVLSTYGSFTMDPPQIDAMMDAADKKGLAVFAANPFPTGRIDHKYEPAQYLIKRGAIPIYMMPHAAESKLLIAQAIYGDNRDMIKEFMTKNNYIGEQPHVWEPDINSRVRSWGQPTESLPRSPLAAYPEK